MESEAWLLQQRSAANRHHGGQRAWLGFAHVRLGNQETHCIQKHQVKKKPEIRRANARAAENQKKGSPLLSPLLRFRFRAREAGKWRAGE